MHLIDWRDLYASNRAVIERAGGAPREPRDWETRTFTVGGRTRRALVHAPAGVEAATAVPLVCMLHGCTQDAASFAAATRMNEAADRHGFALVYPEQERGDNPQGCWNWFLPEHQARGAGEPASIAAIVRELMGTVSPWTIDTRRVFVAGLSAGGAMAAILAAVYPDLFAAVAIHSGLSYRSAANTGAAFTAMARGGEDPVEHGRAAHAALGRLARAVPTIVVHGSADSTVAPVNADQVLAAVHDHQPPRGARDLQRRHRAPHDHRAWPGRRRPPLHALPMDGQPRRPHARAPQGRGTRSRMVRRRARWLLH